MEVIYGFSRSLLLLLAVILNEGSGYLIVTGVFFKL